MDNPYAVHLSGELLAGDSEARAMVGLVEPFALRESDPSRRRVETNCDKGTALEYRDRKQAGMADISLAHAEDLIPFIPITPKTIDPQTDHPSLVQDLSEDSRDA
ncbi:MAG: hypothetical protein VW757_03190 [Halieaceae bacterium]|jgi:hypothetical protein